MCTTTKAALLGKTSVLAEQRFVILEVSCLRPQLKELKQELGALRVAKVTGGAPNKLSKM